MRGAAVHREVRRHPVLARLAGLLVAAEKEDRVVGSGGDGEERQQVSGVRRERDDADMPEKGDDTAGGGDLNGDRHQRQQRGDDRAVDDQQHHRDHPERQRGDLDVAFLADRELVGDKGRRTGDVGLDPGRRRGVRDDFADRGDGLVGPAATGVAIQIHLDLGGLSVIALGAGRRQRVAPEVLDVLNVFGIGPHPLDQIVAEAMRRVTEWLLTLQHDGDQAVGVVLAEHLSYPLGSDRRRRIGVGLRHVVNPAHLLQLRDQSVRGGRQRQPEDGDRNAQFPDQPGDPGRAVGVLAHPDLSRQNT